MTMPATNQQVVVAPQLRRPAHKPGGAVLAQSTGEYVAAARAAAPAVYAKRTSDERRGESAEAVCRALRRLRARAKRIWHAQRRALTDGERELFAEAEHLTRRIAWHRVLANNTPDARAAVKQNIDRAMCVIEALDAYRGKA